jgi:hypothetical protein
MTWRDIEKDPPPTNNPAAIHVVFDGPPGPVSGRFVEVEDPGGRSISAGTWRKRADGFWELVIPMGGPHG